MNFSTSFFSSSTLVINCENEQPFLEASNSIAVFPHFLYVRNHLLNFITIIFSHSLLAKRLDRLRGDAALYSKLS
jgi:hypothetical protein